MQLTYYNNKSDKRYVNKTLQRLTLEGHSNPVNIKLLDNVNLLNPTFKMSDKDLYMTANYCYVDDLHRYYFINKVTLSHGYALLECTCDVLMTYKEALKKRTCVIKRQEKDYNLYQVDDKTKVLNYETLLITNFPVGFNPNAQEFVLCVVGNTSDS